MTTNSPSLKSTILTLKDYLQELLRKWYWFLIFGAITVLIAAYYTQKIQTTYRATASLMLSNDNGNSMSGILRIAGQFGLGGNTNSSDMNTDRLSDLLISQQTIYNSLFKQKQINQKNDLLINHYIQLFNIDTTPIKADQPNKMTTAENTIAKRIYNNIAKKDLQITINKSGILYVDLNTTSEIFSKEFLETHLKTIREYYSNKTSEQQQLTYNLINQRVDSLEKALYNTEYNIAHFVDQYRPALKAGTLSAQKLLSQDQLKRQAEILNVMYAEAIKNREIAHLALLSSRPIVQIIDLPTYPIAPQKPNIIVIYISYLFITTIATLILIIFNKIVRDAFKQPS